MKTRDRLLDLRALQIAGMQAVKEAAERTSALQKSCSHTLSITLQYAIPIDDGRSPSEWWIHIACTECRRGFTMRHGVPLCPTCEMPMHPYRRRDSISRTIREGARQFDPYAGKIYVFECKSCLSIHGFATRIDIPKRKPSPS